METAASPIPAASAALPDAPVAPAGEISSVDVQPAVARTEAAQPNADTHASSAMAPDDPVAPAFDSGIATTLPDLAQSDAPDTALAPKVPGLFDALPEVAPPVVADSPAEAAADASARIALAQDEASVDDSVEDHEAGLPGTSRDDEQARERTHDA